MNARRVRFTATAEQHFETERDWWRKNRDYQGIFETTLDEALARIATHPNIGVVHRRSALIGLRRIYLAKIACHLYYTADEHSLTVRALWGARRGRRAVDLSYQGRRKRRRL